MRTRSLSLISLITSMVIFGTVGIFRKYIDLPSSLLAMARGLIGFLFLLAVLLFKKQKPDRAAIRKNAVLLLLSGIFIGFNWILLFEAYRYTTIATATLCYYMAPILVILAAPILFKEKMTVKKLVCVLSALCGITLVSGIFDSTESSATNTTGILLGLGAAALYASVILMNKKISGIGALDKTLVQLGSAGVVMIPYFFLTEDVTAISYDTTSILFLLIVAIVHTGIAYTMYFGSIASLPAQTVAIFSYIDPVVAIILSAIIFHEQLTPAGIIGAILILGTALIEELPIGRKKEKIQAQNAQNSIDKQP